MGIHGSRSQVANALSSLTHLATHNAPSWSIVVPAVWDALGSLSNLRVLAGTKSKYEVAHVKFRPKMCCSLERIALSLHTIAATTLFSTRAPQALHDITVRVLDAETQKDVRNVIDIIQETVGGLRVFQLLCDVIFVLGKEAFRRFCIW